MKYTSEAVSRPQIAIGENNKITHNGNPTRIVFRKDVISVGCTDVTREALEEVYRRYQEYLKRDEYVVQP